MFFFFFLPVGAFCLRGILARGGFLQEGFFGRRGVFAGGGFWPEGGFGRRGALSGGGFCPVPFKKYIPSVFNGFPCLTYIDIAFLQMWTNYEFLIIFRHVNMHIKIENSLSYGTLLDSIEIKLFFCFVYNIKIML